MGSKPTNSPSSRPPKSIKAVKLLTSPYFSRTSSSSCYRKRSPSPAARRLPKLSEQEPGQEQENLNLFNDPLFCFYFRSFARLYHQLSLLKPILIQESVADDPWKVLVAVTLLNKTAGKAAIPVFWDIISKYPTPLALSQANEVDLTSMIRCLGLQSVRAKRLIQLSAVYIQSPPSPGRLYQSNAYINASVSLSSSPSQYQEASPPPSPSKRQRYTPTPISHLPGAGPYALDSYRIFCTAVSEPDAWKDVMPTDKELVRYLKWKWAFTERKKWVPGAGVLGGVDIGDLEGLASELTR